MIRTLLTTTALAALLSTGAIAQDATTTPAPTTEATPMDANGGMATTPSRTPIVMSEGYAAVDGDNLASRILGSDVFTSANDDAEKIGDINDFVVDGNGDIAAAVIGVGGFLGIGEKNVAVNFADLQWVAGPDEAMRYVLPTTADALTVAPDFVYDDETAAEQAENVDDTTVVADPNATTDQPAMAAPAIDRTTLNDVDMASITTDDLKGTRVYGMNDEDIGTIGDFVLGTDEKLDAVIIDVGGFLGLGKKPVAVGMDNLMISQDKDNNRYLFINTTKEQLEAQPEFNRDTYPTDRDAQRLVVTP